MRRGALPGGELDEHALAEIVASTSDVKRLELHLTNGSWLKSLLRSTGNRPVLLVLDHDDVRALLIAHGDRVVFASANSNGNRLTMDSALELLRRLRGRARVSLAALRSRLVEWEPEKLSTGVKGIDLQHRQLISSLNMLYQAVLLGDSFRRLRSTLGFLREYTVFHFGSEERFFTRYGYPKADEHIRQHRWFVERVRNYEQEGFEEDKALNVVVFLAKWVKGHIAGSDRDWGRWVAARKRGEGVGGVH